MKGGELALDWGALVALVVHPIKVEIVEAMDWIGRPLAASELKRVLDHRHSTPAISYHMNVLAKFGVLVRAEIQQVRGAWKHLYVLAPAVKP
ncbi:MAG TPA: hypothetical protein VE127_12505 [Solirubrobacteraceae bacterium]|nr:hypothetical protein [Solirubrobacteraceae bacterium]